MLPQVVHCNRRAVRGPDPRSPFVYRAPMVHVAQESTKQKESSPDSTSEPENLLFEQFSGNEDSFQAQADHQDVRQSYTPEATPSQPQQPHTTPISNSYNKRAPAPAQHYMYQVPHPQQSHTARPYQWSYHQSACPNGGWVRYSLGRYTNGQAQSPASVEPVWDGTHDANTFAHTICAGSPPKASYFHRPENYFTIQEVAKLVVDVENAMKKIEDELEDLRSKLNKMFAVTIPY